MTSEDAIDVESGGGAAVVIREESDEDENAALGLGVTRHGKRRRDEDGEDSLFIQDEEIDVSEDEGFQPTNKRARTNPDGGGDEDDDGEAGEDDKKKLALNTSYDGFSIYGRILCLVVKRRGGPNGRLPGGLADQGGQQMLENWVSTQAAQEGMLDDDA